MAQLQLSNGLLTIVDDDLYDWLSQWKWQYANGYAKHHALIAGKETTQYLHRLIMGVDDKRHVDHKNGDRLDNRRNNLRWASQRENMQNRHKRRGVTSRFKGVSWFKRDQRWRVCITCNGRYCWIGDFDDEITAAQAYDAAARVEFGEFAQLNFPETLCAKST